MKYLLMILLVLPLSLEASVESKSAIRTGQDYVERCGFFKDFKKIVTMSDSQKEDFHYCSGFTDALITSNIEGKNICPKEPIYIIHVLQIFTAIERKQPEAMQASAHILIKEGLSRVFPCK
ncbi:MAG: hypothetical protein JKY67_08590 [Pseudomonadales bacterium]|nr:hypothetical protein [Pseudomonadales bacterium]